MAQFSLAKPIQPKYNSTTRYLTIFLDAPPVSALVTVAYERLKFDNVFNELRQKGEDLTTLPNRKP
jgi:hypothetical protein